MYPDIYIFTEIINCGLIGRVSLESFHKHHDLKVHVFGTKEDFRQLGDIADHQNNVLIDINQYFSSEYLESFKKGHEGTAKIFTFALLHRPGWIGQYKPSLIGHFDSDVYFKRESISLLQYAYNDGYALSGSRRCFKNNPSGIADLDNYADTISTYFMGIDTRYIPNAATVDLKMYERMVQGVQAFGNTPTLDFFDPISHSIIEAGGKVKYLSPNLIGGQDENGKKINEYKSNLHFDCGKNLVHFGGVGSGLSVLTGKSAPEKSYADWAVGRWDLFQKLFNLGDLTVCISIPQTSTVYTADSRWGSGSPDEKIIEQIKKDIQK